MSAALHRVRNTGLPLAARLTRRPDDGDPHRILILQPDHIGDILLSQPAVRHLREMLPEHELIAVVGSWSEEIAQMSWPVNEIITLDFPGFTRSAGRGPLAPYAQLAREAARLRRMKAGAALILRPDAWWAAWLARLSVPGTVYGIDHPQTRPFLTAAAISTGNHRTVQAYVAAALLAGTGASGVNATWDMSPSLSAPGSAVAKAHQLREQSGLHAPYFVFHPGAGARVKLWPTSRWQTLAAASPDTQVALTGSPDERALCSAIATANDRFVNLAGQTDLGTLAEILRGAVAAVGTDNGAMHIAGAVGTPTVRLFGPSDPAIYGPFPRSPRHRVVRAGWQCPRCGDLGADRSMGCGCMLAITVDQVQAALYEVQAVHDAA